MHSVLIALKKPDEKLTDKHARDANGDWVSLIKNHALPTETTIGIEMLSETVWLIRLEIAMPAFGGLVAAADKWKVPYRVYFFDKPPDWLGTWVTPSELTMP